MDLGRRDAYPTLPSLYRLVAAFNQPGHSLCSFDQRLNTPADSNSIAETFEAFQFHTRRYADTPIRRHHVLCGWDFAALWACVTEPLRYFADACLLSGR
jgi:hypothetical protein